MSKWKWKKGSSMLPINTQHCYITSLAYSLIFLLIRCTQIKTYSWDNAQVILVGNKCDMEDERVISYERGKQLADSLGLEFFETSAKENINVRVGIKFHNKHVLFLLLLPDQYLTVEV